MESKIASPIFAHLLASRSLAEEAVCLLWACSTPHSQTAVGELFDQLVFDGIAREFYVRLHLHLFKNSHAVSVDRVHTHGEFFRDLTALLTGGD